MNVLIACEESQRVCIEFRKKGHRAFSCDILECSGGHPEWHIKGDVMTVINGNCVFKTESGEEHTLNGTWDLIIAHPPCTHLCVSGARWFEDKRKNGKQLEALLFFSVFLNTNCERVAIENPIGIISGEYVKKWFPWLQKYGIPCDPQQIIQPYMFGDPVRKATCLWLKGLPKLEPTDLVEPDIISDGKTTYSGPAYYVKDENGKILSWRDPRTARERSKTYPGIAKAMAEQWG